MALIFEVLVWTFSTHMPMCKWRKLKGVISSLMALLGGDMGGKFLSSFSAF